MTIAGQMAHKDVKSRLSEVVDQVEPEHDRVVITKHGRPAAVVVSIDDLESLEETLEIMSRPRLVRIVHRISETVTILAVEHRSDVHRKH